MKVLAISAHPDDETLGCGGTLLKHRAQGDALSWLIATQAFERHCTADMITRKADEVERVADAYGMKRCFRLGLPTTELDTTSQSSLIERIREVVSEVKPELVYIVHGGDVHSDHRALFTAAMSVLKPFYMTRLGVRQVSCYETLSSTDAAPTGLDRIFVPNVFSNITTYIDRKIQVMKLFETEVQAEPLPRTPSAIRALARYRGATIGVEYAEAFMLIRGVM